ncbi:MAG: pantoate--beta-alanine ligase [Nitrospirae bacterium]|nr:pantoate--beta-alanine ligase [Nitrospirota bacterium]MBF0535626.1 pantoate--beta-alanine ligase [Nitrospirota bacterium]MBF0616932.1 pantoate--beta-alanine ligase [Nitrospirota bacterium]
MQQWSHKKHKMGKTVGFVPTMGALHSGHISLIEASKLENDLTVVSIFVNPAQFSAGEDFEKYPRDFAGDFKKLEQSGIDALFLPEATDMYSEGFATFIEVRGISNRLCGAYRAGHFSGVATIVAKLFNTVMPDSSYFGLKDYQQCVVIRKMVNDLNMPVNLRFCETVREQDGLAMSSRNTYLTSEQRQDAPLLYRALREAGSLISEKRLVKFKDAATFMHQVLTSSAHISEIQYSSVYDSETLDDISELHVASYSGKPVDLAIAVKIGSTRLIDNLVVTVP